jgi:hypothetical protein
MGINLSHLFHRGLTPEQFMDGMTKNQDKFLEWSNAFRWENAEMQTFFETFQNQKDLHCFILASDWCGDVVRNVPVVFHATKTAGIPTEVLIMEEHLDVMDQFLTMGGRSIPVVIFTDKSGAVLGKWGPRPRHVQVIMEEFKASNPDRDASDYEENLMAARKRLIAAYGEDTQYQHTIIRELRDLLMRI